MNYARKSKTKKGLFKKTEITTDKKEALEWHRISNMQLIEISKTEETKSQEMFREINKKIPRSEGVEYFFKKSLIKCLKQLMKKYSQVK